MSRRIWNADFFGVNQCPPACEVGSWTKRQSRCKFTYFSHITFSHFELGLKICYRLLYHLLMIPGLCSHLEIKLRATEPGKSNFHKKKIIIWKNIRFNTKNTSKIDYCFSARKIFLSGTICINVHLSYIILWWLELSSVRRII